MNLYKTATKLIPRQSYTYFSAASRTLDSRGIWVSSFAVGVALLDVIQAVDRRLYDQLGLDVSRKYIMIYTDNPLLVVDRDISGDEIDFNGFRWHLESDTDWNPQDGWRGVLAVRQLATGDPTP